MFTIIKIKTVPFTLLLYPYLIYLELKIFSSIVLIESIFNESFSDKVFFFKFLLNNKIKFSLLISSCFNLLLFLSKKEKKNCKLRIEFNRRSSKQFLETSASIRNLSISYFNNSTNLFKRSFSRVNAIERYELSS